MFFFYPNRRRLDDRGARQLDNIQQADIRETGRQLDQDQVVPVPLQCGPSTASLRQGHPAQTLPRLPAQT